MRDVDGQASSPYFFAINLPLKLSELTVTAKGQVTLRKDVLAHLGVNPGDKLKLEALPNGELVMRRVKGRHRLEDLAGMLKPPNGKRLTIEEMNEFIARGWAGDFCE